MIEESGIQELTFEEIDAVSGAGWLTDLVNWVGRHVTAWFRGTGTEEGFDEYEGGIKISKPF